MSTFDEYTETKKSPEFKHALTKFKKAECRLIDVLNSAPDSAEFMSDEDTGAELEDTVAEKLEKYKHARDIAYSLIPETWQERLGPIGTELEVLAEEFLDKLTWKKTFLNKYGDLGAAVLDFFRQDVSEAVDAMKYRYIGEFESVSEWARQVAEQREDIPEDILRFINFKEMAEELEMELDVIEVNGRVHIFTI